MRFEETIGISAFLRSAHQALRQETDEALARLKISAAQYAVLATLEEHVGATNALLAKKCSVTPQTMSRLMQGLETAKFVKKESDPEHGLKFTFQLTKRGVDTVCSAHTLVNQIEETMLNRLPKKEIEKLKSLLKICAENLAIQKI